MTLNDLFHGQYRALRLRNRSQRTVQLYSHTIASYSRWLGRPAELGDLANDSVSMWLADMVQRKLSPATVNKHRSQLLALWNWAARRRVVPNFPDVPPEPMPKRAPLAWTVEEMERLVAATDKLEGSLGSIPWSAYWRALILVAYDSAERISALLELEWAWLQGEWIKVPAEVRKGRRQDMVYRLGSDTLAALEAIRWPRRPKVFPWPLGRTYIWRKFSEVLKVAGLDSGPKSKFHRIRRTTASLYAAAGGDATHLLGHSSDKVTRRYLDPRLTSPKQPSEMLPRIVRDSHRSLSDNPRPPGDDRRRA